jgi:hypothetical protein
VAYFFEQIMMCLLGFNYKKHNNANPQQMVQDDPKLPDASGKIPKPNGVVGSLIPKCEIIFLFDGN